MYFLEDAIDILESIEYDADGDMTVAELWQVFDTRIKDAIDMIQESIVELNAEGMR